MTVRVQKDSINLREKLSELDKPSGIAGQDILKADTPQEVFNYINAGRRNLLINGDFQVWQRGTSFAAVNGYCADRFKTLNAMDVSKQSDSTFPYFIRIQRNGSATGCRLDQWIETPPIQTGDYITLSFWAKASDSSAEIQYSSIQDQAYNNFKAFHDGQSLTTSWAKYQYTMQVPSGYYNNSQIRLAIARVPDGATYSIDIARVQLEVGKVATPFEHRSYGEELALCMRYYWKASQSGVNTALGSGVFYNTTQGRATIQFPVEMRTNPTLSVGNFSNLRWQTPGSALTPSANATVGISRNFCFAAQTVSGATAGQGTILYSTTSDGGVAFDAEL